MKTKEQLTAEVQGLLKAARDICDLADREGRDFTPEEREKVAGYLKSARELKSQIRDTEKAKDEEFKNYILELSEGLSNNVKGSGKGSSSKKGGAWSEAFRKSWDGRKELLTPSGSVGVPALSSTIPAEGERLETILQVLPPTPTDARSVEYLREVTRTQNAAPVADKGIKPTSVYELEEISAPVEVIAHLSEPVPRRYLSDYSNLERYLDVVLRQGLILELENQIINGDGISPNLEGMLTVDGHVVIPADGSDDFSLARKGITALELLALPTDELVFAIHPIRWEELELAKVNGGDYILQLDSKPSPINRQRRQLWGVPVVPAVSMPTDRLLLFHRGSVELFEREQVNITWSENTISLVKGEPVSDFARNLIRFRAEGRWALAIHRPEAICEILLEDYGS